MASQEALEETDAEADAQLPAAEKKGRASKWVGAEFLAACMTVSHVSPKLGEVTGNELHQKCAEAYPGQVDALVASGVWPATVDPELSKLNRTNGKKIFEKRQVVRKLVNSHINPALKPLITDNKPNRGKPMPEDWCDAAWMVFMHMGALGQAKNLAPETSSHDLHACCPDASVHASLLLQRLGARAGAVPSWRKAGRGR